MIGSCTFMLFVANPKKLNDSLHCSALICFICCLENRCALQRTKLTANNTIQVSASCEKNHCFPNLYLNKRWIHHILVSLFLILVFRFQFHFWKIVCRYLLCISWKVKLRRFWLYILEHFFHSKYSYRCSFGLKNGNNCIYTYFLDSNGTRIGSSNSCSHKKHFDVIVMMKLFTYILILYLCIFTGWMDLQIHTHLWRWKTMISVLLKNL